MNLRTDLALERREIVGTQTIKGVASSEKIKENTKITLIEVMNEDGSKTIGKPVGKYITVEVSDFTKDAELLDGRITCVADELKSLLPKDGSALVVGLGNNDITPDALGPKCVSQIFATRHINEDFSKSFGLPDLRPVAAISPGVLGQTGIETAEIIAGIVQKIKPSVVITVDALAARRLSRLGNTVQMSDTGIEPGSGVGNTRVSINEKTLGIKVISMGVPTVVDAATLANDIIDEGIIQTDRKEDLTAKARQNIDNKYASMMVTPREIDLVTQRAAKLLALSINSALQPSLTQEDFLSLI